ncbi:MAG: fumarate hydratase [Ruminococcaceae bacterium]|nr:fumarate hydratase [Oscillospiraceae bacterium]
MKLITANKIEQTVASLCRQANTRLPEDLRAAIVQAGRQERTPAGRAVMQDLAENARIASELEVPICQDTGMVVVFVEIGQDVTVTGDWIETAIQRGVARGYREGYLRYSVVSDPLQRQNTGDNTPAVIHYSIVQGDQLRLVVAPKGFGSENMSAARMLSPSDGEEGIRRFVLETVQAAGPNPCPPVVIGLGLGGTLEKAALLAKQALLIPVGQTSPLPHLARLEEELLKAVNSLGIGPGGLGGQTTALALHILSYPTHIAGLPVVINMSCHATRHAEAVL